MFVGISIIKKTIRVILLITLMSIVSCGVKEMNSSYLCFRYKYQSVDGVEGYWYTGLRINDGRQWYSPILGSAHLSEMKIFLDLADQKPVNVSAQKEIHRLESIPGDVRTNDVLLLNSKKDLNKTYFTKDSMEVLVVYKINADWVLTDQISDELYNYSVGNIYKECKEEVYSKIYLTHLEIQPLDLNQHDKEVLRIGENASDVDYYFCE